MFLFFLKHTSRALGSLIVLLLVIRGFVIEPGRVNGQSMERTFLDTDLFLVNKYILLLRAPERGDIVQAIDPLSKHLVIKRVIGLPGERLAISNGKVYLRNDDGEEALIDEPWLAEDEWTMSAQNTNEVYIPVPSHSYFLMGDNRDRSTDSRTYSAVHRKDIYGLVMKPPF